MVDTPLCSAAFGPRRTITAPALMSGSGTRMSGLVAAPLWALNGGGDIDGSDVGLCRRSPIRGDLGCRGGSVAGTRAACGWVSAGDDDRRGGPVRRGRG